MTTIAESARGAKWASEQEMGGEGERARERETLVGLLGSMVEWKTSKLQSAATKTAALSSQPASKDFLNYQ